MIAPTPEQMRAAQDAGVDVQELGLRIEHAVQRGIDAVYAGTDQPLTPKGIAFETLAGVLEVCGYPAT